MWANDGFLCFLRRAALIQGRYTRVRRARCTGTCVCYQMHSQGLSFNANTRYHRGVAVRLHRSSCINSTVIRVLTMGNLGRSQSLVNLVVKKRWRLCSTLYKTRWFLNPVSPRASGGRSDEPIKPQLCFSWGWRNARGYGRWQLVSCHSPTSTSWLGSSSHTNLLSGNTGDHKQR